MSFFNSPLSPDYRSLFVNPALTIVSVNIWAIFLQHCSVFHNVKLFESFEKWRILPWNKKTPRITRIKFCKNHFWNGENCTVHSAIVFGSKFTRKFSDMGMQSGGIRTYRGLKWLNESQFKSISIVHVKYWNLVCNSFELMELLFCKESF